MIWMKTERLNYVQVENVGKLKIPTQSQILQIS